ncbi:hypothetical protein BDW02DRAFT_573636 [Decorospora gaudefroyi]|uniref:Uncharacterized protein n=1 Tax=Decorospora gaudefroyi TaxID=184978 RepID=A0A6A5K8X3_9PLEO|nr:hypothetical protein BDW02DRAFT_573636 [Decorospora gaudefroyi]
MPPKAATADKIGKVFSADVVAAVLYSTGTTSLSMKHYEMMSALDGTKTASGFQHDFRAVIAKSKELRARVEAGEEFESVPPAKKRSDSTPTTTPKATPKKRKTTCSDSDSTPCKKKPTPKTSSAKKSQTRLDTNMTSNGEDFPADAEDFIKNETSWEDDFA